jgi:hypothetical protein
MAKLFYTLEEAAQKLGKSTDEIMNMAKAGQLQELRDKDQVLFRRSAIDQLAGDSDVGSELNLEGVDLGNEGSTIGLGGTDIADDTGLGLGESGGLSLGSTDELRLDDADDALTAAPVGDNDGTLSLDDGPGLELDDLRLDDDAPSTPVAASGADDSMALDDLVLDNNEVTLADEDPVSAPASPRAPVNDARAASASGISGGSSIGLAGSSAGSRSGSRAARTADADDSMVMDMGDPSVESVGAGSGLLDISSDESFFGAQMIEESLGGEELAQMQEGAGDLFAAGGEGAGGEEAAPVTSAVSGFGMAQAQLAEALDSKFSGFTAGAMVAVALALVGAGWATTEFMVGDYVEVARMVAENWMMVLGGVAGAVLVFGGIGFGIGKATA